MAMHSTSALRNALTRAAFVVSDFVANPNEQSAYSSSFEMLVSIYERSRLQSFLQFMRSPEASHLDNDVKVAQAFRNQCAIAVRGNSGRDPTDPNQALARRARVEANQRLLKLADQIAEEAKRAQA